MQIQNIEYMDENKDIVKITEKDGNVIFSPYPSQTWHAEYINEWLEENEIQQPPGPGLEDIRNEQLAKVQQSLSDSFSSGMSYTFPDDKEGVVQLGIDDRQNLTALALRTNQLISEGLGETEMEFRSLSNEIHTMTANEVNEMANAAMDYVSSLYKKSWNLKDAIRDAKTEEEIKSIEWDE